MRIISFLFLVVGVVFFPLPLVLFIFILCVSFFQKFWEGVLVGVLLDTVYAQISFYDFSLGLFSLSFVAIILISEKVKSLIYVKSVFSR